MNTQSVHMILRTKIILLTNENEENVSEENKIRKVYIAWT